MSSSSIAKASGAVATKINIGHAVLHSIPCLKDNFSYILETPKMAILIDSPCASTVAEYVKQKNIKLTSIFATHEHTDHTGGIQELQQIFPNLPSLLPPDVFHWFTAAARDVAEAAELKSHSVSEVASRKRVTKNSDTVKHVPAPLVLADNADPNPGVVASILHNPDDSTDSMYHDNIGPHAISMQPLKGLFSNTTFAFYPTKREACGSSLADPLPQSSGDLGWRRAVQFRTTIADEPVDIVYSPGHTPLHLIYYFPKVKVAFVGDILFRRGCGRVCQSLIPEMQHSMVYLSSLPNDVYLCTGHDYAASFEVTYTKYEQAGLKFTPLLPNTEEYTPTPPDMPAVLPLIQEKRDNMFLAAANAAELAERRQFREVS